MPKNVEEKQIQSNFANHEIVVLALYQLGGRSNTVDTEDVAFRSNELAPGRFSWRKYKYQIDIDNIRSALRDAKKEKNNILVSRSDKEGWRLTQAGIDLIESLMERMNKADLSKERMDRQELAWVRRERNRLIHESCFIKAKDGRLDDISIQEIERFFRVDDYIQGASRMQRLNRVLTHFGDDPELGTIVRMLASHLPTK